MRRPDPKAGAALGLPSHQQWPQGPRPPQGCVSPTWVYISLQAQFPGTTGGEGGAHVWALRSQACLAYTCGCVCARGQWAGTQAIDGCMPGVQAPRAPGLGGPPGCCSPGLGLHQTGPFTGLDPGGMGKAVPVPPTSSTLGVGVHPGLPMAEGDPCPPGWVKVQLQDPDLSSSPSPTGPGVPPPQQPDLSVVEKPLRRAQGPL